MAAKTNINVKVPEKFLYEIWKNQDFTGELFTVDGKPIKIINTGTANNETDGPDFLNAKIKIGDITFTGDVEIDSYSSDWKFHGHYLNNKYNKVILHLTFSNGGNSGFVFTTDGRKIYSVEMKKYLKENVSLLIQKAIESERKNRIGKMPCMELCPSISVEEKLNYVQKLGVKRFNAKCMKMLGRIKELAYLKELNLKEPVIKYEFDEDFYNKIFKQNDFCDIKIWQQLIYEYVFEALGYTANKDTMRSLARSVDIEFLSRLKNEKFFFEYIEAALYNVSGLIPECTKITDEETSGYIKNLLERWNKIKDMYDGRKFKATQWNFAKLRPPNFPTLRIAGGAKILYSILNKNMIDNIIRKIESCDDNSSLVNEIRGFFIIKSFGYWKNKYVFDQSGSEKINYVVGRERADEIIVNIILPIMSIYFEIFSRKNLAKKVLGIYVNYYQRVESQLVREISQVLSLEDSYKRSVLYQGMIELFRNFCVLEKCKECEIGQKVFI